MERAYKFRIYPNTVQQQMIAKTFGCCRFVYNHYLAVRQSEYALKKKSMTCYDCIRDLTQFKKEYPWLAEVDSTALRTALEDLDRAYANFFSGLKSGRKVGYPQYKRKHVRTDSYRSSCNTRPNIKVLGNAVQLPKLGIVKCRVSRVPNGRILSATVSKSASGKYFVSLCCTDVEITPLEPTGAIVGLNLGIEDLAVTSDGEKYPNNRYAAQSQKKLAKLQRQLSRKTKGSKNYEEQRVKVAKLYEHIANQRNDSLQKLTTDLVRKYDLIFILDLDVQAMMQNPYLAGKVADASIGELRRQLEYKSKWYGKKMIAVDKDLPSSQLCSSCGYQNKNLKNGNTRSWVCPNCSATLDRDVNAATNILKEGLKKIAI